MTMDNKWSLFQKFLITENVQITIEEFLLNSLIAIVLSLLLQFTYLKCANSISNLVQEFQLFPDNIPIINITIQGDEVIIMMNKIKIWFSIS